eukprot:scaffold80615_cov26-Prasinocladus_malaysianus.AAC.1
MNHAGGLGLLYIVGVACESVVPRSYSYSKSYFRSHESTRNPTVLFPNERSSSARVALPYP